MMGHLHPFPRLGRWEQNRRSAFTLLELLVAMSVLALLLILLLSMVSTATRLWKTNENRVDSYREARAAVNLIASDLAAIYPSPEQTYFYTQEDNLPVTPVHVDDMDGSIFFLAATPADAQDTAKNKSDLCTIGYFLGYDKTSLTGNGTPSYNLYRYFRSSDDTFKAIATNNLLADVTIDTSPTSVNAEVLAKNITGFKVKAYTIPPPPTPGATTTPVKFKKSADTPLPDIVEIEVTAINNDVAKRFGDNQSDWENPHSVTREQSDRIFKTRVYLNGAAQVKPTPVPAP